ncbi:MAG: alkaline phosphatase family protein [Candidatus Aenigmatarchaeota archaeon]
MSNIDLKNIILEKKSEGQFLYPFYEKYCLSNIPSTILKLFGIKPKNPILGHEILKVLESYEFENILFLILDGFGYNYWKKYSDDYWFFRKFEEKGHVFPLTTIFPSSTAPAITTINTGFTPQEHGLLEWVVYFKEIDMIINTLPFSSLIKKDQMILEKANPKILYNGQTIYQKLKKEGIKSFSFISHLYSRSKYSKIIAKGSETISFLYLSDLFVNVRKKLENFLGKSYYYIYIDHMDSIEHKYGLLTDENSSEISSISFMIKQELSKVQKKIANKTIVFFTSDHGQTKVYPNETIYLNRFKKLDKYFQKGKRKNKILPTGSPRDVFLHIKPEMLDETIEFLKNKLKGKCAVLKTEDAIKRGLFGIGKPTKKFMERVGNVLILPYRNNTIWYKHTNKKFDLLGHHGGLSKDEMLIPFAFCKLSDLIS